MTSMANSEMSSVTMDVCSFFFFFSAGYILSLKEITKADFSTYSSSFLVSEMRMAPHLLNPHFMKQLGIDHRLEH